tara:strand:- start:8914 stop:10200 length:1287 start_codon:yes stop_codon:yes gene_type:complete
MISQVQESIVYVFNKILINFFKEIKKEQYFKLAIKKNYKVIDKKSHKYIKYFSKKMFDNIQILCEPDLDLKILEQNEEFTNTNIFKNINIGRLLKNYDNDNDKKTILSYIITLSVFNVLYEDSRIIYEKMLHDSKNKEDILNEDDDEDDNDERDEEKVLDDEDEDNEDDEDDNEDDDSESEDDMSEEAILHSILTKSIKILSSINNNVNVENDLNEIMDDDVRILLSHINELKVNVTNNEDLDNTNIDNLLGNSKIGQLAKEISNNIDLDQLNINTENPEEMLNPANLFNGENGNLIGNLVQQVGSSITEKMNSGELKQEDLLKDAFSLMNKMQNSSSDNPIIDNMVKNMMNTHNAQGGMPNMGDNMDMNSMMQQMMSGMGGMDQNSMQQMMNSMGGTQGLNQNNPNSREGKAKERLRKKLAEKKGEK